MRPNKPINSGAHRSGTAGGRGKSRYFSTDLPKPPIEWVDRIEPSFYAAAEPGPEQVGKYQGRATVGPGSGEDETALHALASPAASTWVDPLDADKIDLTAITIDLRESLIESPPETYYQRHSSRVPGHQ